MRPRQVYNPLILAFTALCFFPILPAQAQSVDELQRQLEAQQQINAQLRQRVMELEETIESLQADGGANIAGQSDEMAIAQSPQVGVLSEDGVLDESDLGALEQALVQRGSAVLPAWTGQIIPGVSWGHNGSSITGSASNIYSSSLSARMGLPSGFMVGMSVPYIVGAENPNGDNSGIGDISFSLAKQLLAENDDRPSLLAQFGYIAPTGADSFETLVPLGSGFHSVQGSLSAVKSIDPVAFYGDVSYAHSFSRTVQGSDFQRGGTIGFGVGSTLAATPEIALSLGMNFAFVDNVQTNGVAINGTDLTVGSVNLGAGFLLSQRLYLSISGQFGVTEDASDLGLSIALPMRF